MEEMKIIKTFESFNDPNKKTVEKIQLSSYITKSDFFALKKKAEKDFIKKNIGKEFENWKKDTQGDYVIETGDPALKEIVIAKKFVYEITKK
jgi:hypothetical protein